MSNKRKKYGADFKAKVALPPSEAVNWARRSAPWRRSDPRFGPKDTGGIVFVKCEDLQMIPT